MTPLTSKQNSLPKVSIVIPLYNEKESFSMLIQRLKKVTNQCSFSVQCILVDDGSVDGTSELIRIEASKSKLFKGLILSKNYGHQKAISAGMAYSDAEEAVMIIDGDLQDPPELVLPWYELIHKGGYDVVYGVRQMRDDEGVFKKSTSILFYRLLNKMISDPIPLDSGDFCMMSRRVVKHIVNMPERYRFIRGMRSSLGFRQKKFPYERQKRAAGETKYTLRKMVKLALDAIYGFSEVPYKLMMTGGLFLILIASFYLCFSLIKSLVYGTVVSGFLGILAAIILVGGINLLGLGVLGGYVVRNFFELKSRPLFIVDEVIENQILRKVE